MYSVLLPALFLPPIYFLPLLLLLLQLQKHQADQVCDPPANQKQTGLDSYTVSLESQTADVYTRDVPFETVLEKIKKTGKAVRSAERDGESVEV